MAIRLTPAGHLRWSDSPDEAAPRGLAAVRAQFEQDWPGGLFTLAAEKVDPGGAQDLRYWRDFAARYLTALCHVPAGAESFEVALPTPAECAGLILTAPPMQGGEYLSEAVLGGIWEALDAWVRNAITRDGGLEEFLASRAPRWRQVGRVCFHLAENKSDPARPFAFMATYTAGFGASGQLKHQPLRKALEQYATAKNRPALVKLLSPVHEAAKRCDWVKALVDSSDIYQPMAWPAARAYTFLRSVPDLEESGLSVTMPDWWKRRPRPRVSVTIGEQKKSTLGAEAMLDFNVAVALGDTALSPADIRALLAGEDGLVLIKGQWVEVDREKLREAIGHWEAIQAEAANGEISFVEGMRLLAGASRDLDHEVEDEFERAWVHVGAGEALREVLAELREPSRLAGEGYCALKTTLRAYQRKGVAWMRFLTELGLGACLADDMGLGKTIQVLALLLWAKNAPADQRKPSLLVVPASLLGNWRQEAERFAPSLRLQFLHPAEASREEITRISNAPEKYLAGTDLAVTTYAMLTRQPWLAEQHWNLVILDEAQAIKNPSTGQAKTVKKLRARARIALTGTPVENRLGDLWSLFDFINPGLLGSAAVFKRFVKGLQARERNHFAPLRQLAGPYILRRLKTDRAIISDLPDKTETTRYCNLTKAQVKLYEQAVQTMKRSLGSADGIGRRGLVLQTLMRLKQICNHPSQLAGDGDYIAGDSGKFLRIAEICEELAERQEKVLVFTQFREIIDPLSEHLQAIFGRSGLVLHGGTGVKKRKEIVARFQDEDGPPFFILSLKAGGTGLNLTAAAHVIHFDRWWNPAVENQATDRAFRIGQKRNVLVHKFVTRGTVEERIDALIEEKRQLATEMLSGEGEVNLTELPDDELMRLVRLDVNQAAL
ncbi:MAG: DEAD/DEAH box helicase [Candidatus Hydrogenedentes bacterium]|nr:DEAD/DEAH box helicase [Candidatus Hydrogenedentota bacterium]